MQRHINIERKLKRIECGSCGLVGLLNQSPGNKCCSCFGVLVETWIILDADCPWCTDEAICSVCAGK